MNEELTALLQQLHNPNPVARGAALDSLKHLINSGDDETVTVAAEALMEFKLDDPGVITHYNQALYRRTIKWGERILLPAIQRYGKKVRLAIALLLGEKDRSRRYYAEKVLENLRDDAAPYADLLAPGLRKNEIFYENPDGWSLLLGLRHKELLDADTLAAMEDYERRRDAWHEAVKAIDFNLPRLQSSSRRERLDAASRLAKATERHEEIGRAILAAFVGSPEDDPQFGNTPYFIEQMAGQLASMGSAIAPLAPELMEVAHATAPALRNAALVVLQALSRGKPAGITGMMLPLLDDANAWVRLAALLAIYHGGMAEFRELPGAADLLARALRDELPATRLTAAEALGELGRNAQPARDALLAARRDLHSDIATAATRTLKMLAAYEA